MTGSWPLHMAMLSLVASPCDSGRLLTILVIAILIAYSYGKQFKTAYACTFLPAASILGKILQQQQQQQQQQQLKIMQQPQQY